MAAGSVPVERTEQIQAVMSAGWSCRLSQEILSLTCSVWNTFPYQAGASVPSGQRKKNWNYMIRNWTFCLLLSQKPRRLAWKNRPRGFRVWDEMSVLWRLQQPLNIWFTLYHSTVAFWTLFWILIGQTLLNHFLFIRATVQITGFYSFNTLLRMCYGFYSKSSMTEICTPYASRKQI